jgi:hypothetical protein
MLQVLTVRDNFTMVPNRVLLDPALGAKALKLFAVLEHHCGQHRTCWPGYPALAKEVGCSVRWLPEVIDELVKAGYLHVQFRLGKTNIYTLLLRVARRQANPTHEGYSRPPRKPSSYEQKQPTKTNIKGGSTPSSTRNKGPITFDKYLPGGTYPASVIS